MAGLVPAIHVFFIAPSGDVDARDKRGHDGLKIWAYSFTAPVMAET
jgi:hypothetical protein